MKQTIEPAYAKLNLTLDVLGKRPDGYHSLKMVMQSVSLCDRVTLTLEGGEGIRLAADRRFLPTDDKNIAVIAANAFSAATGISLDGLTIRLEKRIPVCAGTAGGSSDGAAVLRGLNRLCGTGLTLSELAAIGEKVGSDVPYCVMGGTALAEGRGEVLTPLPALPDCHIVMCKPNFPVSTPELFHKLDSVKIRCRPNTGGVLAALDAGDLPGVARQMYNVFEDALPPARAAVICGIRNTLIQEGALGACLSGTGPTTFGLFDREDLADHTAELLRETFPDTFLVRPVGAGAQR